MNDKVFELNYAGHPVRYAFLTRKTRTLLHPIPRAVEGVTADVAADRELIERVRPLFPADTEDSFLEYRCLIGLTAQRLLHFGCCVFHAVAFLWRGRAWLLTAPPGVGKTTQLLNWQRCYPGEIAVISGDMPVLEGREDGSVWVHPSSWNGKENLRGRQSAPLGGVVLLEQGSVDQICPLPQAEGILPLFNQFMVVPETEEEIHALAGLMEKMLTAAPCWRMVNRGGNESTALLRATLQNRFAEEAES